MRPTRWHLKLYRYPGFELDRGAPHHGWRRHRAWVQIGTWIYVAKLEQS